MIFFLFLSTWNSILVSHFEISPVAPGNKTGFEEEIHIGTRKRATVSFLPEIVRRPVDVTRGNYDMNRQRNETKRTDILPIFLANSRYWK